MPAERQHEESETCTVRGVKKKTKYEGEQTQVNWSAHCTLFMALAERIVKADV